MRLEKKAVSGIMLTLLLINMLTLTFNTQPVKASGTIYIRSDGSVDPPTVPIKRDGNVYTFISNIRDEIVVQSSNIIIDGNGYVLQGYAEGWGFYLTNVSNVTIKRTCIKDFCCGIRINAASFIKIFSNIITDNYMGISACYLSSSNIYGNNVTENCAQGILLSHSSNNTIHENYITNNQKTESVDFEFAISLESSSNNSICENYIASNDGDGISLSGSYKNIIRGNYISNNWNGVYISSTNNIIINNSLIGNDIKLIGGSTNNIILGNKLKESCVWLGSWGTVSFNIIQENNVSYGDGIILTAGATSNTVYGNNVEHCSYGIGLYYASNNTMYRNELKNNNRGIDLFESSINNIILENNISGSTEYGIHLERYSSSNRIYHNNFINNMKHAYSENNNVWDDGYPSGGNYWDNYEGEDKYCGPSQDQLGSDGIGDTAYYIEKHNWDRYPLINPWIQIPPAPNFSIASSPTSLTIQQGGSDTSAITITSIGGFDQPVQLTVSGTPSGATAALNPEQVTPPPDGSTTSTLTVSVGTTATLGSYTLTVTGSNGTLTHSVNISLEITASGQLELTFDLSLGWQTKELFVPIFYRSHEEPGAMVLGVHNRRDMWYLIKVYKKMPDKTWMEIIPDEFLKGSGPYMGPWSERTFVYTPQMGDEIKIQVWNDMNDGTLWALWGLDFVTRALTGIRVPPKFLEYDWQTIKSKLNDFYNDIVKPVKDALLNKAWKTALIEMCKAILKAPQLYSSILIDLGFEPSVAAGIIVKIGKFVEGALRLFAFFVNIPTWKDLLGNLNKEPFIEEVIFTAKYKAPFVAPNVKVTESLTILQKEPYYVGQTIDAQFTVINKGTAPITFNVLTVGGRGPKGEGDVRDFTFKTDITLNPGGSYNYKGELKLLDNGTYHFFVAYQTSDGKWETSVPTEAGITNTVDIFANSIPEKWVAAELGSPSELRVFDSQGKVTGIVNGEEKNEIPYSTYYENIVVILAPADSYRYEVIGTSEGSYSLTVRNATVAAIFNATTIPTSAGVIHRYTVDWVALSQGQKGVAVQIDSNGDGTFEKIFTAGTELTGDEFMQQVAPKEAFPMWIAGVAIVAIAIVTIAIAVFWRKRKRPPTKG